MAPSGRSTFSPSCRHLPMHEPLALPLSEHLFPCLCCCEQAFLLSFHLVPPVTGMRLCRLRGELLEAEGALARHHVTSPGKAGRGQWSCCVLLVLLCFCF